MIEAGRLRQRVTIQESTETETAGGDVLKDWEDMDTVWASIEPLRGREYFDGRVVEAEQTVRIRMRYRSDVTEAMRIVHNGTTYEIRNVADVGMRGHELEIMAVTRD
jgi:SPP1 family predicted phage head-tail adaptor